MSFSILLLNKSHFKAELESLGCTVVCGVCRQEYSETRPDFWSIANSDFLFDSGQTLLEVLTQLPEGFTPDRILCHDDSSPYLRIRDIHTSPVPIGFYSVDSHIHRLWQPQQCGGFDLVLAAQKDVISFYRDFHPRVEWMPLWAPRLINPHVTKDIDVCFRGNLNPVQRAPRVKFLEDLASRVQLDYAAGSYEDSFSRAKIVINENVKHDLNFRVFEAMMCGALLVTPDIGNGLRELFTPDLHLAVYEEGDPESAAQTIDYYLKHEDKRAAVAAAGRAEVLKRHTAESRARKLLELFMTLDRSPRRLRYSSQAFSDLLQASIDRGNGKLTTTERLLEINRALTQSLYRQECCDLNLVNMVVSACAALCEAKLNSEAFELAAASARAWAQELGFPVILLALARIFGRSGEALEIARPLVPNVEQFNAAAPQYAQDLLKSSIFWPLGSGFSFAAE